ncbi:MAG: hypothetical protein K2P86_02390 [Xanthobacteraceae bacterium]|jgi:hypothetical protein|nr:hypothetical protein [Xanthobacteraceae bacterium]
MKFKAYAAACAIAVTVLGATNAQAQQPSIASAWGDMNLSLERCLSRGQTTFDRLRFKRIEAIGYTVYGDFGNFQVGIRCLPDKNLFYVFGGGPGDQDKQLLRHIDDVKGEFLR